MYTVASSPTLDLAVAVAARVVGDLHRVRELRRSSACTRCAARPAAGAWPCASSNCDADAVGALAQRLGQLALALLGLFVRSCRCRAWCVQLALLAGRELAEHQLALAEQPVVALGRRAQPVERRLALVRDRDLEVERLAGHADVVLAIGRSTRDRDVARALVLALAPVDAELLAARPRRGAISLSRVACDHRLGVAQQLAAAGARGLRQQLAREAGQELVLVLVLLEVLGARLAQALARLGRQVVAQTTSPASAPSCARAWVRCAAQVGLAQVAAVDEQVHVVAVDRHRVDLDVGHDADALDRDVARREVLRDGELERPAVVVVV